MKRYFSKINNYFFSFGIDIKKLFYALRGIPLYISNFIALKKQEKDTKNFFSFALPNLCLDDRFMESGAIRGHYFYQDWLVANRIFINNPTIHVDVGSRVDGFVTYVAAFRPIQVIDIRPLELRIHNIKFIQANLMLPLDKEMYECCDSLSCLHTLEHFGLGRYGDPVNYDGYLVGLRNLRALLKHSGKLYLSVPIGPQRIEYNAHRIFSVRFLLKLLEGQFVIDRFSYVDDRGDLHINVQLSPQQVAKNFGCYYGCGIFEMTKQ